MFQNCMYVMFLFKFGVSAGSGRQRGETAAAAEQCSGGAGPTERKQVHKGV